MYKILGVLEKSFTFDNDGRKRVVHGFHVFCSDDSRRNVDGVATYDFFMSDSVCHRSDYTPKVGDCLDAIYYNRFNKVDRVFLSLD